MSKGSQTYGQKSLHGHGAAAMEIFVVGKRSVYPHTCLWRCPQLTYSLLKEREQWARVRWWWLCGKSPLNRASAPAASSVQFLSGTAFKMISDVIFRSQKRAPARASASIRPLLTIINQGRPSTTLQSWRHSRLLATSESNLEKSSYITIWLIGWGTRNLGVGFWKCRGEMG